MRLIFIQYDSERTETWPHIDQLYTYSMFYKNIWFTCPEKKNKQLQ